MMGKGKELEMTNSMKRYVRRQFLLIMLSAVCVLAMWLSVEVSLLFAGVAVAALYYALSLTGRYL